MSTEERKLLAKDIAEEVAKNHTFCRVDLTPDDVSEIKGLCRAARLSKKVGLMTAVGIIVTLLFTLVGIGFVTKIGQAINKIL
jgi:hypothetical protein